jgi:hypothetical protein
MQLFSILSRTQVCSILAQDMVARNINHANPYFSDRAPFPAIPSNCSAARATFLKASKIGY